MMKKTWFSVLAAVLALSGCAGLKQFPAIPEDIPTVLDARDKEFTKVLEAIKKEGNPDKKKSIRNDGSADDHLLAVRVKFFRSYAFYAMVRCTIDGLPPPKGDYFTHERSISPKEKR